VMFGCWASRIPDVKADLDLSAGALGLALLGAAIGSMFSLPLGGAAAVRFGSARTTRTAYLTMSMLVLLPGLAVNGVTLFLALFLWGAAMGGCDVAMNIQAVSVERRFERASMSGFHAMLSLGALVGAGLGSLGAAWSLPVAVNLGLIAVVLLVGFGVLAGRFVPDPVVDEAEAAPLFARPSGRLLAVGAIAFIVLITEGAMADWSAVYLREDLDATVGVAGLGFAAFSATMTLGRLAGDRVVTWWGVRRTLYGLTAVAALGLGAGLSSDHRIGTVVGFAVLGLGLSATFPLLVSDAGSGRHPGAAIAAVTTCGYVGFLVGPPALGALAELVGLRLALGVLPALLVVACVLTFVAVGRRAAT
jgi:MFS family permease